MSQFNWCFTVPGVPIAKPRQTQSDRWKQREPVVKYRAFADLLRLYAQKAHWRESENTLYTLILVFYLPIPKSVSLKQQKRLAGHRHPVKPDLSNLIKSVEDSLFLHDQAICAVTAEKLYDDGKGPRTEITILSFKEDECL